jgi:VanZ family protein
MLMFLKWMACPLITCIKQLFQTDHYYTTTTSLNSWKLNNNILQLSSVIFLKSSICYSSLSICHKLKEENWTSPSSPHSVVKLENFWHYFKYCTDISKPFHLGEAQKEKEICLSLSLPCLWHIWKIIDITLNAVLISQNHPTYVMLIYCLKMCSVGW